MAQKVATEDPDEKNPDRTCCEQTLDFLGINCVCGNVGRELREEHIAEVVQNNQRVCTDILCLLLLVACFVSQIVMISVASDKGAEPKNLLRGRDYKGTLCDKKRDYPNGKFAAWPDASESSRVKVCVHTCEQTRSQSGHDDSRFALYYPSKEVAGAYCVPTSDFVKHNLTNDVFDNSASASFDRGISDLDVTKWAIMLAGIAAIICSLLYIRFMAAFAKIFVFLALLVIVVAGLAIGIGLTVYGYRQMDAGDNGNSRFGKGMFGLGILVLVLWFLFMCLLVFLRKRITLTFEMMEEASRAVRDMKGTLIFPVIYSICFALYFAFWIAVTLFVYSVESGEHDKHTLPESLQETLDQETYIIKKLDSDWKKVFIFNCFLLFYFVHAIFYFGYMVLAGTFADWYFSHWDTAQSHKVRGYNAAELSEHPICESLWRTFRFHIGTVGFAALLMAVVNFTRACLEYMEKTSKDPSNKCTKCVYCCVRCCLSCCACILDCINKNGLIITTVYGHSFCYSSSVAVRLILNNFVRTAMVSGITQWMQYIGIFAISCGVTAIFVFILEEYQLYDDQISSILLPAVFVFIVCLCISKLFLEVYEVAVDAIFMCFLIDESTYGRAKFAHDGLLHYADQNTQLSKSDGAASAATRV